MSPHDDDSFLQRVRPPGWKNPAPRARYDMAIIGAGPAGLTAAEFAVRQGFSVALIEHNRLGGNSLNVGSVPSKAIIRTAIIHGEMHNIEAYGEAAATQAPLDFPAAMARMRRIRTRIAAYHSADHLAALGVDLFFGAARFESAGSLTIGETRLQFRAALIATGARPRPPDIPGIDATDYHTSSTIFEMAALPKRLAVIGGGPLGCELAQAFARLGAHVTIVQNDPKFLPREERDAAEILSRALARDGVDVRLNTSVVGARREGDVKILKTLNDDVEREIEADEVLVSVGRVANVEDLGLEAAGVACDAETGITIDDFLRSTNPNIYAAGDACMWLKFTNAAEASARLAVRNALMGAQARWSDASLPWCTFCDPEIAHIGMHAVDARRKSIPVKSFTVMMHDVDRAITDGEDLGFVKILMAEDSDRILGATIVAARASEMINEMAVVMVGGVGLEALADIPHTYPAQTGAILLAAQAYRRQQDERRLNARLTAPSEPAA
jgi:pyruvate/2-oxoglutarate dehydrogenase complex dihydrolipoamide dehydrogenase (E3) component